MEGVSKGSPLRVLWKTPMEMSGYQRLLTILSGGDPRPAAAAPRVGAP